MSSISSSSTSSHSATSQMLGYLYQMERALFWLVNSDSEGYVFIETDDDVVVRIKKGLQLKTIFEQDKISTVGSNNFTDASENLWKTLAIWMENVKRLNLDPSECSFILSTNTKTPKKSSFVKKISEANDISKALEVYDILNKHASNKYTEKLSPTATQKKMNPFYKAFLDFSKADALNLISNISLIENLIFNDRDSYKNKIRHLLQCPNEIPLNVVYDHLVGWIQNQAVNSWIANNVCKIHNEAFYKEYSAFKAKYILKPHIEKTVDSLPISGIERSNYRRSSHFVKQIEQINVSEEECFEAIDDFIRQSSQKTQLAMEGYVSSDEFDQYEEDLRDFWKQKSRQLYRKVTTINEEDIGYDLFTECKLYKGKLKGVIPEQKHTSRGTYHSLSNLKKIGWHPKWKKL